MLQELSHMDRITQLQDEIQQVRPLLWLQPHQTAHLAHPHSYSR